MQRRNNRRTCSMKSYRLILKFSLIHSKPNSTNKVNNGGYRNIPNLATTRPSELLQQIQNRCKWNFAVFISMKLLWRSLLQSPNYERFRRRDNFILFFQTKNILKSEIVILCIDFVLILYLTMIFCFWYDLILFDFIWDTHT